MTSDTLVRGRNRARWTSLAGTASLMALAAGAAYAQPAAPPAAEAPVEEVLVTGSLIRGAEAVGIPVTALGEEDFQRTGAVTIADMLKDVPAVSVNPTVGVNATSGGNRQRLQNSTIHGLSSGTAVYSLLMVDGKRYPAQGTNLQNIDPSVIPTLAVAHLDILAAGASATYGSDAVSGVFNVVLKRGIDGGTSMFRISESTDLGWSSHQVEAQQLYGRSWDNFLDLGKGDITLTYDWWEQGRVYGPGRNYYTPNFEPFGFDNRSFLGMNKAGIISTGNPASATGIPATVAGTSADTASIGTRYCDNCFSVPAGTGWNFGSQAPGPAFTWAALLANKGVTTEISPETYSWMNPAQQNTAGVITFDQTIIKDLYGLGPVSLFVTGWYQNRRGENAYIPGYSPCVSCITPGNGLVIPTTNPYYPIGVPAGTVVRANLSLTPELVPFSTNYIVDRQFQFGFNFEDLPFGWHGQAFGSLSEEHSNDHNNGVNANMFNAALGNTVASVAAAGNTPPQAAFTKPAALPYLNPFCDRAVFQCDAPATIAYLTSDRVDDSVYQEREYGGQVNGPIVELPGGMLTGAVAVGLLRQSFHVFNNTTETTFNTDQLSSSYQTNQYVSSSITGELNVPLVGQDMHIPLVESLVFDLGYRGDDYQLFGWVKTPKLGANWAIAHGLTARAAYGTSFTAPGFGNVTDYQDVRSTNELFNTPDTRSVTLDFKCPSIAALGVATGTVQPGSLQSVLNPNRVGCPAGGGLPAGPADPGNINNFNSIADPVGLQLNASLDYFQGRSLSPETSKQWSLGWNWAPKKDDSIFGILNGLSLDAEYWHLKLSDVIGTLTVGNGVNDPLSLDRSQPIGFLTTDQKATRYVVIPRPDLPITDPANASFLAFVNDTVAKGKCDCNPAALPFIKFIDISGIDNTGWTERAGVDLDARYDADLGEFGTLGTSVAASIQTRRRSRTTAIGPITDTYTHIDRNTGVLTGTNSGNQVQGGRLTFTWTDPDAHWTIAPTANWSPHSFSSNSPPACFWHPNFGPSNPTSTPYGGLCYPGAPYYPQAVETYAPGTAAAIANQEQRWVGLFQPSAVFINLAVSYKFGDEPASIFLKNLRIALNVNDLLNRLPSAISYDPRTTSGSARIRNGADFQRTVALTLTKAW